MSTPRHRPLLAAALLLVTATAPAGPSTLPAPPRPASHTSPAPTTATPAASTPLLQAHLAQAQGLAASAPTVPADAALRAALAPLAAQAAAWATREAGTLELTALDGSIPALILARAAAVADDDAAASAWLAAGVSLPQVLALAAVRNGETRAAYVNWQAVRRRFEQAANLEEMLTPYRAYVREIDTMVGPASNKEEPGKTFAFPALLALKGQVVDTETRVAWLAYLQARRSAMNEAARLFFEIQHETRKVEIFREHTDALTRLAESLEPRLKSGMADAAEALKARAEAREWAKDALMHAEQKANTTANCLSVLRLPPNAPWGPFTETDLRAEVPALADLLVTVAAHSQELQRAVAEEDLARLTLRLAETEVLPRAASAASRLAPALGAVAGPTRVEAAAFPARREVTMEPARFGADAAFLDELRVRVRQAAAMRQQVAAQRAFAAQDARFRSLVAQRELGVFRESSVPLAQAALDNLRSRYLTNGTDLGALLTAFRDFLVADLNAVEARREFNMQLVNLQDAQGATAAALLPAPEAEGSKGPKGP